MAARGGVVKFKQYHGAAGHYLVIDGERTGIDYTYMHLRDAALVNVGDRVRTGQLIGYVGQTGRASGCHLHFEMWSAPGWYDGGSRSIRCRRCWPGTRRPRPASAAGATLAGRDQRPMSERTRSPISAIGSARSQTLTPSTSPVRNSAHVPV